MEQRHARLCRRVERAAKPVYLELVREFGCPLEIVHKNSYCNFFSSRLIEPLGRAGIVSALRYYEGQSDRHQFLEITEGPAAGFAVDGTWQQYRNGMPPRADAPRVMVWPRANIQRFLLHYEVPLPVHHIWREANEVPWSPIAQHQL